MGIKFDTTQLIGKLEELDKKVQKNISDEALREGAKILLKGQEKTVPRDTGQLANSLIIGKITGSGAKRKILVGINPAKAEKVSYGYYQEYGTTVMLGKKWMKRAWISTTKDANKAIGQSLSKRLSQK